MECLEKTTSDGVVCSDYKSVPGIDKAISEIIRADDMFGIVFSDKDNRIMPFFDYNMKELFHLNFTWTKDDHM